MRTVSLLVLLSTAMWAAVPHASGVFEEAGGGATAWVGWSGASEMLVFAEGFALRSGERVLRFRWDRSLGLNSLQPEGMAPSNVYELSAAGPGRQLAHAGRIRVRSKSGGISILYYFGLRGLEFDIEAPAGAPVSYLRLESEDADFSRDELGRILVNGRLFALQPVAYTEDGSGRRLPVEAGYRVESKRVVRFEIGSHSVDERLVVDPVVTYATYFSGTDREEPVAVREMPDGTVLIAGNTRSFDLPMGVSLTSAAMAPPPGSFRRRCFIARLSAVNKQVYFTSYFGGGTDATCSSVDVDSSGRILLAGSSTLSSILPTANAEYAMPRFDNDAYLARISADGKSVDYATFLNFQAGPNRFWMKSGPLETVYIAVSCMYESPCAPAPPQFPGAYSPAASKNVLLRYNLATRHYDQKTYLPDFVELGGMELRPAGVYLFGSISSPRLPVKNAFQPAPPLNGWSAGAVFAMSADFRDLVFSSYLGGQNLHTGIAAVLPLKNGGIWLTGEAYPGSIPDLPPVNSGDTASVPFAVLAVPGAAGLQTAWRAPGSGLGGARGSLLLAGGAFCMTFVGSPGAASPGGAVIGTTNAPLMGCVSDAGNDFEMITPIGSFTQADQTTVTAPSASGGLWSFQLAGGGGFGDVIPYELKGAAIQPFRPGDTDDLVLRYIDLNTPVPTLVTPQPMRVSALKGNTTSSMTLAGRNFSAGMQLKIGDAAFPLTVNSAVSASFSHTSSSFPLPAGTFMGQLVIPTQPQPVTSDFFQVIVGNLPPAYQPFTATSNPRVFNVVQPVYGDSQVLWNGAPIPYSGGGQLQIPADIGAGTGELTLVNQGPGGGLQREVVTIGTTSSTVPLPADPKATHIDADLFQVDRARKVLYVLLGEANQWTVASYSLPDGLPLAKTTLAKGAATTAVDFRISTDGSYLYFTDDRLKVVGWRADGLVQDFEFQIPRDAPPASNTSSKETRHKLRAVEDSPGSVLVVTPAGRMILYDRDQQRVYSSADFPSTMIDLPDPVLVTSTAIYSVRAADQLHPVPCVARHGVDGLGFGPVEDTCNLASNWGKYPEMTSHGGALFLESRYATARIYPTADNFGSMISPHTFDSAGNLDISVVLVGFDPITRAAVYRLAISAMDTGATLGHYPGLGVLRGPFTATVTASGVVILDDGTMVYLETSQFTRSRVAITPDWQSSMERYP